MVVGRQSGETAGACHAFDALARALSSALAVPLVVISLASSHGQDVVGAVGLASATSLCRQVVQGAKPIIVHDVRRRISVGSEALAALDIAGYAGVPIVIGANAVGTVAALDHQVRAWSERDLEQLRRFAAGVAHTVAIETALERERALTSLLVTAALATNVEDVLAALAAHVGWPRAELVTVDDGPNVDAVAREALGSGKPIWHADVPGRDDAPAFAIAIPDSDVVLELFTGGKSRDPGDLARSGPAVAAMLGALLRRPLALHDELTGLLNRRGFYAVAGGQLAIARRKAMPGMVLFVDVDGLKRVNDRDGHSAGDALLRLAGSVLRSAFRESDTIARVGGDEFVVFSIDATDRDFAVVIDRLSSELARSNASTHTTSRLRWSVGHVCFEGAASDSLDDLIVAADRRMYETKRATLAAASLA